MVLYLCLIPNCGARIGHQTDDHFKVVAYCKKNDFIFVYHPFMKKSKNFEDVLKFGTLHDNDYENTKETVNEIINIKDLSVSNVHNSLIKMHKSDKKIMLFDNLQGNENFHKNYNINEYDVTETKKTYRNKLMEYFPNYSNSPYICIHIRRGDIINMPSRYLSTEYFINKYIELLNKIETKDLPVYVITEDNFDEESLLYENIKTCNIIKTDEITSFYYLVNCSYLVASRSGFSNLAYILGDMKVLVAPQDWNPYWDNTL